MVVHFNLFEPYTLLFKIDFQLASKYKKLNFEFFIYIGKVPFFKFLFLFHKDRFWILERKQSISQISLHAGLFIYLVGTYLNLHH